MKTVITLLLTINLSIAAQAQTASNISVDAERKAHLEEVLKDPKSDLTEKGFAFLFANLEKIQLAGQTSEKESLKSFVDNFEAFISNMFSMFSFASDEEDEEPTNIETIESYKCDKSGNCHLALKLVGNEKRIYYFKVILNESNIPVAIKDNKLYVK